MIAVMEAIYRTAENHCIRTTTQAREGFYDLANRLRAGALFEVVVEWRGKPALRMYSELGLENLEDAIRADERLKVLGETE